MNSNYLKNLCLSLVVVITIASSVIPLNKIEAKGEAAIAIAAGIGAICGAAIASNSNHKNHRQQAHAYHRELYAVSIQQQTMDFVLSTYHPANHDAWVRYVIVDCSQVLNPMQQSQLIGVLNNRHTQGLASPMLSAIEMRTPYPYYR